LSKACIYSREKLDSFPWPNQTNKKKCQRNSRLSTCTDTRKYQAQNAKHFALYFQLTCYIFPGLLLGKYINIRSDSLKLLLKKHVCFLLWNFCKCYKQN